MEGRRQKNQTIYRGIACRNNTYKIRQQSDGCGIYNACTQWIHAPRIDYQVCRTASSLTVQSPVGSDHAPPAAHQHVHRTGGEDTGGHRRRDAVCRVGYRVQRTADETRGALRREQGTSAGGGYIQEWKKRSRLGGGGAYSLLLALVIVI